MTEKTTEEIEHEREQVIKGLGINDFKMLSPSQFALVQQAQLDSMNTRARTRMDKEFEGKVKAVAKSLTEPPFTFKTGNVRVMAGAEVKFTTLIMAQVRDAHRRLDKFLVEEDPNNIRSSDFLNRELLAHSIFEFNNSDFGGVSFDPQEYQNLRSSSPEEARKILDEVRQRRQEALDNLSPHVVDRLIEYYQAFQITVEAMSKSEDMDEALGN